MDRVGIGYCATLKNLAARGTAFRRNDKFSSVPRDGKRRSRTCLPWSGSNANFLQISKEDMEEVFVQTQMSRYDSFFCIN